MQELLKSMNLIPCTSCHYCVAESPGHQFVQSKRGRKQKKRWTSRVNRQNRRNPGCTPQTRPERLSPCVQKQETQPERILADKIYRNRQTLAFCKEHGIRLSGPALGKPPKIRSSHAKQRSRNIRTAATTIS